MALTKISRGLLDTGVSDSSDATAITIDSSENVGIGLTNPSAYGKLTVSGTATQLALNASSGKNRVGFFEAGTGRFYIDTLMVQMVWHLLMQMAQQKE